MPEMTNATPNRRNPVAINCWWAFQFFLLIVIPFIFILQTMPSPFGESIFNKDFKFHAQWINGEWYRKKEGNVFMVGDLNMYDLPTEEIQYIPLEKTLQVPKGLIATMLHLPEEPIRYDVCFNVQSYLSGTNDSRIEIKDYPILILFRDGSHQVVNNKICINSSPLKIMMGAAPGTINESDLWSAIDKVGVYSFSGTKIRIDNTRPDAGMSPGINYSLSGSHIIIDGVAFDTNDAIQEGGGFSFSFDPKHPNFVAEVDSHQIFKISARPYLLDLICLGIILLTAWWTIAFAFINALQKIYEALILAAYLYLFNKN